jgi:hypothetical protein
VKHVVTRHRAISQTLSKFLANPTVLGGVITIGTLVVALGLPRAALGGDAQERGPAVPASLSDKAFIDRVNTYLTLQKKLEAGLTPLKPSEEPTRIEVHQRGLAERLREARANAKVGDVFGSTADAIRRSILADAQQRPVRDVYAQMMEVPVKAPPAVNADYPEKAPLATVPPLLLARLPRLPDGVEYRFLGRDLILRDTKANVIVDIVREAIPILGR